MISRDAAKLFTRIFPRDGCLNLQGIFETALIDEVFAEFERQFPIISEAKLEGSLKVGDRRLQLPIEVRGPLADPRLSTNPMLLAVIDDLLGPEVTIDSVTCVVALPGAKVQNLHRDYPRLGLDGPFAVTVAMPLVDLSTSTGSTLLFPGSHVGDDAPCNGAVARPALLQRGDCYLMDYALWHQGMSNHSDRARPILCIVYARSWFTDDRNFKAHAKINLSRSALMGMPLDQRRLFRRAVMRGAHDLTEEELLRSDAS